MKTLKRIVRLAIVLYLSVLVFFFIAQRHILFVPTHTYTPLAQAYANRTFQEISVRTDDGVDLKAWYAPPAGKPCTIVFFHGNGDSLLTSSKIADPYIAAGYGFLVVEYRGYSGLQGSPSEAGLYQDASADLRGLEARGVDEHHIILYGHSLGTGVAIEMATEIHPDGVMLLAPYLSIPKAAQSQYPFLPAELLALDRFNNEEKIGLVHAPLLIANGDQDGVIPPSQGRKLYARANEPKEFHSLAGRGHNDAFDAFAPVSLNWLGRICPGR